MKCYIKAYLWRATYPPLVRRAPPEAPSANDVPVEYKKNTEITLRSPIQS